MLGLILRIIIIITASIQFFPGYYISELALSFLPYWTGILLICVIIAFLKLRQQFKRKIVHLLRPFLLITLGILFLSYANQTNKFYNSPEKSGLAGEEDLGGVSLLYGNIQKDNTDYEGIKNMIEENNPDVLLFVEFSENHYTHLKDFLQSNYPYINSTTRSEKFIGSMVFSKYPIENRANDFPQGARKYAYFSLELNKKESYYIYLVHASSPDSLAHFTMRNKQLNTFLQDIQSHQQKHRDTDDNILILGDFNASPWSKYYKIFDKGLGDEFVNITQQLPFLFTRKLKYLPFLQSHIDHVRSNNTKHIQNLQSITIPGSDHKGLLFYLQNF